jgi:hypothetical protein
MTKLYKVQATIEYVIAADEGMQHLMAPNTVREACHDIDPFDIKFTIDTISTVTDLPQGWDDSCYPYRMDSATPHTIGELINEQL